MYTCPGIFRKLKNVVLINSKASALASREQRSRVAKRLKMETYHWLKIWLSRQRTLARPPVHSLGLGVKYSVR